MSRSLIVLLSTWVCLTANVVAAEPPASDVAPAAKPAAPAPAPTPTLAEPAATPTPDPRDPPETDDAPEVDAQAPIDAETPTDEVEPAENAEPTPQVDPIRERAQQVRDLVDGTLDVRVQAPDLFVLDLTDPLWAGDAGQRLSRILARVGADAPPRRKKAPPRPDLASLDPDTALETAYREFLGLSAEQREQRIATHAQRRTDAKVQAAKEEVELVAAQAQADQLRAYLAGTLDVSVDPQPLLRLDLLAADELALDPQRRARWLGADVDAGTEPPTKLDFSRADLDLQRRRYLALPAEDREALAETHLRRMAEAQAQAQAQAQLERAQAEAAQALAAQAERGDAEPQDPSETEQAMAEKERAAAQRKEASAQLTDAQAEASRRAQDRADALQAAARADTDAKRALANERARLLGIQEEQANLEADLARRRVVRAEDHDRVLDWQLRVTTLAESPMFPSEVAAEADPMYRDIREDLGVVRQRLDDDLVDLETAGEDVPGVGTPLDAALPSLLDRGDIPELRRKVARKQADLSTLVQNTRWELAGQTRDDVVALNNSRLRLLDLASADLRRSVTSFGAEGIDQAKREFKQISLEVGYFLASLPRYRATFFHELVNSTVQVAIALVKFVAVLVAFVWWRRRGTAILEKLESALRARRPMNSPVRFAIASVWYLRRVRRPLVVLGVIWGLLYVVEGVRGLPSFSLVWTAATWILLGFAAILLIDALAARENLYSASKRDNSELRIHSLRVVGANVIAVGLILALTSEMVGRGAIYSWMFSTCWWLSLPVAIYLIHRWKPIIVELVAERPEQTAFTRWLAKTHSGVRSFPAATAGAAYLLGKGSAGWTMRQLSGLEVTRRLLAYLFRRELAKQAAATGADGRFRPIGAEVRTFFAPEITPRELLAVVAKNQLEEVIVHARSGSRTLSVVVGERGLGKSAFVHRLSAGFEDMNVHSLSCPEEGLRAMYRQLAEHTGNPSLEGPALIEAVRGLGRCIIVVDDLQRLVIPAVNGLRDLDAFTAFSREVGGEVSWVVTIGSASWQYIRRARGDRVSFEQVVVLPKWSEEELGALIKAQCEQARIDPSFDGLIVPRQNSEPLPDQGDRTEASYYRLLWDFSKGNPAVALHAFRESLFQDERGNVVVRLFSEPPPEQIESLTLSQLFVLRTFVQLELAVPHEIQRATQLPLTDVEDAIRFCNSRGYVEPFQGGYRLSWPWYRTITTVLQRQHLLSSL